MRLPVAFVAALAAEVVLLPWFGARAGDAAPAPFVDAEILGPVAPLFRIESMALRYTHIEQSGRGFQSRAGPRGGPGDEWLRVEEPELEVVAKQGDKLTHRLWVPVDIVTAASPDAIDVVSTASRRNEAGSVDWTASYQSSPETSLAVRTGLHGEENWRSWNEGFTVTRSLAEANTTVSAGANQIVDWFDAYNLVGKRTDHTARASSSATVGVSQVLSTTTLAHADYGITLQRGQLSNTWNTVPLSDGGVALEILPKSRTRHALSGRIAQYLPWEGAVHGSYRFYVDDWGIRGNTLEFELHQRLMRRLVARANYRFHTQTSADFFQTSVAPRFKLATADSDLASLDANAVGLKLSLDLPLRSVRSLHADIGMERYVRSNDLRVSLFSCGFGLLF